MSFWEHSPEHRRRVHGHLGHFLPMVSHPTCSLLLSPVAVAVPTVPGSGAETVSKTAHDQPGLGPKPKTSRRLFHYGGDPYPPQRPPAGLPK